MDVKRHERIAHIQRLSEYLRRVLTVFGYLCWLLWPVVLTVPFASGNGTITVFGDLAFRLGDLDLLQRLALTVFLCSMLALTQRALHYARNLMECFSEGDIFNRATLETARKAIWWGAILLSIEVLSNVGIACYRFFSGTGLPTSPLIADLFSTVMNGLLFFGLIYVLLWALEIGRDLHEESELTI